MEFHYYFDHQDTQQVLASVIGLFSAAENGGTSPVLTSALRHSTRDRPVAPWFELCRCVMAHRGGSECELNALRVRIVKPGLCFEPVLAGTEDYAPVTPNRVAQLAAGVYGRTDDSRRDSPANAQEALICAWLNPCPERSLLEPELDLSQLLIDKSGRSSVVDRGALGRLQLWRAASFRPDQPVELIRAPGAALLPVDGDFAQGLDTVRRLLREVVEPNAGCVAWDLRPLDRWSGPAPELVAVSGESATAALAYGALFLLRDRLKPEFTDLRCELMDADPTDISITAGLRWQEPGADGRFAWPLLSPVEAVDDKLAAFNDLPQGRRRGTCYVAGAQSGNAANAWFSKVDKLDDLIRKISSDHGSGLTPDAKTLHALLLGDAPVDDLPLIERVAAAGCLPGIKGYLVWRYAVRACGLHRPFGEPVRLDQHFVRLQLAPEQLAPERKGSEADDSDFELSSDAGSDRLRSTVRLPAEVDDLAKLLHGTDYAHLPAFVLVAGPLAGKTTLLSHWEMKTARDALQRHDRERRWGEVCVFLPMRRFAEFWQHHEQKPADALAAFITELAPALPRWGDLPAADRRADGLEVRLLIDAVNEISPSNPALRDRAIAGVVECLADACTQPSNERRLLPPVFSVRERERSHPLASTRVAAWRAHTVQVLDWRLPDMRRYIELRGLRAASAERLLQAIREGAEGEMLVDGSFGRFCATPGILAAQCTLLERSPGLALPNKRGVLLLALLWHALQRATQSGMPVGDDPDGAIGTQLVAETMRSVLGDLEHKTDWRLPSDPGVLFGELICQARAMQDRQGGTTEEVALDSVPPGLLAPKDQQLRLAWLRTVRAMGLVLTDDKRFAFSHQQWQELFSALGLESGSLDLAMLPLDPPDEDGLRNALMKQEGASYSVPADHPQVERVRFAVELCSKEAAERWIRDLIPVNLPLAARVAIDNRERLEQGRGYFGAWKGKPHPLLQYLRRRLLLTCVDAGAQVKARVEASGVHDRPDTGRPGAFALDADIDTDPQLNQQWEEALAGAYGKGVDIRRRLEAGFLLGELGDTLRYRWVEGHAAQGLTLKEAHWIPVGTAGQLTRFRIGDNKGHDNQRPEFDVHLPYMEIAAYPVTVQEFRSFIEAGGYDTSASWWGGVDALASKWMRDVLADHPDVEEVMATLSGNPLDPANCWLWAQARAFAGWRASLQEKQSPWLEYLPTEIEWEAAVRGPNYHADRPGVTSSSGEADIVQGDGGAGYIDPIAINSNFYLGSRSPVGTFASGYTTSGVADALGNVNEWVSNLYRERYEPSHGRLAGGPEVNWPGESGREGGSLRGGDWGRHSHLCAASRFESLDFAYELGFRMMRRPLHLS